MKKNAIEYVSELMNRKQVIKAEPIAAEPKPESAPKRKTRKEA